MPYLTTNKDLANINKYLWYEVGVGIDIYDGGCGIKVPQLNKVYNSIDDVYTDVLHYSKRNDMLLYTRLIRDLFLWVYDMSIDWTLNDSHMTVYYGANTLKLNLFDLDSKKIYRFCKRLKIYPSFSYNKVIQARRVLLFSDIKKELKVTPAGIVLGDLDFASYVGWRESLKKVCIYLGVSVDMVDVTQSIRTSFACDVIVRNFLKNIR